MQGIGRDYFCLLNLAYKGAKKNCVCTTFTHRIYSLWSPWSPWSLVTNRKATCAESLIRGCLTIQTQTGLNLCLGPPFAGIFIGIRTRGYELSFYRLKVIISLLRLSRTQVEASICGCCTTPTFLISTISNIL